MKQYVKPLTFVVSYCGHHILAGSGPKMAGGVYDSSGNFVDGTDFKYGGEGSSGDEGDAKRFDAWSTWDD